MLKKIPVADLALGMYVHSLEAGWLQHSLWRTRFLIADEATLHRVRTSGASECWIDLERGVDVARPAPAASAPEPAAAPAAAPGATPVGVERERAAALLAQSKQRIAALFREARLGRAIEPADCIPLVEDVVQSIRRNADALVSLVRLKSTDEYTYMHSVAVCTLMVSLALQLRLGDAQCRECGLAGMLHDLGKAAMPPEILNKPARLTPEEFELMKQHPLRGQEMLQQAGMRAQGVLDVCRHHHERIDGNGYPDRLDAAGLSLYARMGAICDVYDAVTSERPYKAGWDPAQAIAEMAAWQGHFDPKVFQAFVKCVGIYPTGSLVRMKSGRLGIIVEHNPQRLLAPKVKLFFSARSGLPLPPKLIDLADPRCREQIEGRESADHWHFTGLDELWAGEYAEARGRGRTPASA